MEATFTKETFDLGFGVPTPLEINKTEETRLPNGAGIRSYPSGVCPNPLISVKALTDAAGHVASITGAIIGSIAHVGVHGVDVGREVADALDGSDRVSRHSREIALSAAVSKNSCRLIKLS